MYCLFFPLQNAVCFIILTYLVPVLFAFYIQGVLKLKKNNSGAKRSRETSVRNDCTRVIISCSEGGTGNAKVTFICMSKQIFNLEFFVLLVSKPCNSSFEKQMTIWKFYKEEVLGRIYYTRSALCAFTCI